MKKALHNSAASCNSNQKRNKWQNEVDAQQSLIEKQRQQAISNYNSAASCNVLPDAQAIGARLKSIIEEGKYGHSPLSQLSSNLR